MTIITDLEYTDSLERYYELQKEKQAPSGLTDIEEAEYEQLYNDILNYEENR